jgi:hypothetical protein
MLQLVNLIILAEKGYEKLSSPTYDLCYPNQFEVDSTRYVQVLRLTLMQKTPMQFNSSLIKSASLTIKQMQGR